MGCKKKYTIWILFLILFKSQLFSQIQDSSGSVEFEQHFDAKTHNPLYRKTYVIRNLGPQYEIIKDTTKIINGHRLNLWYSNESMLSKQQYAQNKRYQKQSGFGGELLFGNLLAQNKNSEKLSYRGSTYRQISQLKTNVKHGLYAGFGVGWAFYDYGNRSNIVLNTTRQDSGFTQLFSQSMSLWGKLQYEFNIRNFYPFLSIAAGPRMFYTNQKLKSFMYLADYESPTNHNVYRDFVLASEIAVGMHWRIHPNVSVYTAKTWWFGGTVNVMDLENTKFTGLAFSPILSKISSNQSQWKFGVSFHLYTKKYSRKIADDKLDTFYYFVKENPPAENTRYYDSTLQQWVTAKYFHCTCCKDNPTYHRNVLVQKSDTTSKTAGSQQNSTSSNYKESDSDSEKKKVTKSEKKDQSSEKTKTKKKPAPTILVPERK